MSLVGDRLYAADHPPVLDRQALHAATLAFHHPRTHDAMRFEAPLPADMGALIPTP